MERERELSSLRPSGIVSIMDLIMYDAQRQGRLSFYMVSSRALARLQVLKLIRSLPEKRALL